MNNRWGRIFWIGLIWFAFMGRTGTVNPARADEAVEKVIISLRLQIQNVHARFMRLQKDLGQAWKDYREEPTPANEQRINRLSDQYGTLSTLSRDLWNALHELKQERSMTLNTLRQIMGSTQEMINDMAELARGVVPGATWILGVSQKTLYNDRWKEAEEAFVAMARKGRDLRRQYQEILKHVESRTKDTPRNREELKRLQQEIKLWRGRMETVQETFLFLRADMPAEVMFWNELAGPYVKAFAENVKAKLEEILVWDTLGGTSPAERIYKLFKPVIQLKIGESFFSDPVLTDKVRNIVVMEVLFAGAPLDRLLKSAEVGVGKFLDTKGVQKVTAELLGSRKRRAELRATLQSMAYDRIPAKGRAALGMGTGRPSGPIERFIASGLSADEVNRIKRIKNSKAIADGFMKVANELIGPAMNWSAFQTAFRKAKEECRKYRAGYRRLRAAKVIWTYEGEGGHGATSGEDNFVNACFDDPDLFTGYMKKLKGEVKGTDVQKFSLKETFRGKTVELENDPPEQAPTIDGQDYGTYGRELESTWEALWNNQIAPEAVGARLNALTDGLWHVYGRKVMKIKARFLDRYRGERRKCSCIEDYSCFHKGFSDNACPGDFLGEMKTEMKTWGEHRSKFQVPFHKQFKQEVPPLIEKCRTIKQEAPLRIKTLVMKGSRETAGEREKLRDRIRLETAGTEDGPRTLSPFEDPESLSEMMWQAKGFANASPLTWFEALANGPAIGLQNGRPLISRWSDDMDAAIEILKAYLSAKQEEKATVLARAAVREEMAERLGEHRNFYLFAQIDAFLITTIKDLSGSKEDYTLLKGLAMDEVIEDLADYAERFTAAFDPQYRTYQELLERLRETRDKIQQFAGVYNAVSPQIQPLFDQYCTLFEALVDGFQEAGTLKTDVIVRIFKEGIATDLQGSQYLKALMDEAQVDKLTQAQIDFIVQKGHEAFVQIPRVPLPRHPMLRDVVTPYLERINRARAVLQSGYLDQDMLIQEYRPMEAKLLDLQARLNTLLRRLQAVSAEVAPGLAARLTLGFLASTRTLKGYNDWFNLRRPVSEFHAIPASLGRDLHDQERLLFAYHALVDKIIEDRPISKILSPEVRRMVAELEMLAEKVDQEGPGWLTLDAGQFTLQYNQISGQAHDLYARAGNLGQALADGPVHQAYVSVLERLHPLDQQFREALDLARVKTALKEILQEARTFLDHPGTLDCASGLVSRLEQAIEPGADADKLKTHAKVSTLIKDCKALLGQLRHWLEAFDGQGQSEEIGKIKDLYGQFKSAYESKNETCVMGLIGDDWEAGDGTTIADLEMNLSRSFRTFDEIRYSIQDLNIQGRPGGTYFVTYQVNITSRIYSRDLKHVEKSSVSEEVTIDPSSGKARISRTLGGRFWTE